MDSLIIESSDETPSVTLDKQRGIFRIAETSYPEDSKNFYKPILQWLEKYFSDPNPETMFEFNLSYYNTSSAKMIAKILSILADNRSKSRISVKWYYEADDTDLLKSGQRFSQLSGMDFEYIETQE